MANRKACSTLIVALVVFTGLRHAFVPAPARSAAPMAAAGGMLSVLGAQAAHADKIMKAIASMDGSLVTSLEDYTAINAAIGHMVASAGQAKTMDVYNAIAKFNLGKDIGPYMMSKVNAADAKAAYVAFLEFKNAVKASM